MGRSRGSDPRPSLLKDPSHPLVLQSQEGPFRAQCGRDGRSLPHRRCRESAAEQRRRLRPVFRTVRARGGALLPVLARGGSGGARPREHPRPGRPDPAARADRRPTPSRSAEVSPASRRCRLGALSPASSWSSGGHAGTSTSSTRSLWRTSRRQFRGTERMDPEVVGLAKRRSRRLFEGYLRRSRPQKGRRRPGRPPAQTWFASAGHDPKQLRLLVGTPSLGRPSACRPVARLSLSAPASSPRSPPLALLPFLVIQA